MRGAGTPPADVKDPATKSDSEFTAMACTSPPATPHPPSSAQIDCHSTPSHNARFPGRAGSEKRPPTMSVPPSPSAPSPRPDCPDALTTATITTPSSGSAPTSSHAAPFHAASPPVRRAVAAPHVPVTGWRARVNAPPTISRPRKETSVLTVPSSPNPSAPTESPSTAATCLAASSARAADARPARANCPPTYTFPWKCASARTPRSATARSPGGRKTPARSPEVSSASASPSPSARKPSPPEDSPPNARECW
mmetsp:Transcript_61152/g.146071  ORF Transcript_61152/g.146071 Transcript_61152/m.146071 type:complete len:253 (+) Transcript_61152:492-1250(+)